MMTVVELIEQLMGLPGDETVYRSDSERDADGTQTRAVSEVELDTIEVYDYASGTVSAVPRVIIS
jgi:hypothetical protein